jgi:hypothetical protein
MWRENAAVRAADMAARANIRLRSANPFMLVRMMTSSPSTGLARRSVLRRVPGKKFLFILSPPLCGSTAIKELIEASEQVSAFQCEGQFLPGVRDVLGVPRRWDHGLVVDWNQVRGCFLDHWDLSKPVLLEKSPPHIMRAEQLATAFDPAYFIVTMRNPYAQAEGLLRRGWKGTPREAATFWVKCAERQVHNQKVLRRALSFTYEQLADSTSEVLARISGFIPELSDVQADRLFTAHNLTGKPLKGLVNLNDKKIRRLDDRAVDELNVVLRPRTALLSHFGYSLLET